MSIKSFVNQVRESKEVLEEIIRENKKILSNKELPFEKREHARMTCVLSEGMLEGHNRMMDFFSDHILKFLVDVIELLAEDLKDACETGDEKEKMPMAPRE